VRLAISPEAEMPKLSMQIPEAVNLGVGTEASAELGASR
jgi:hypothetical protein